MPGPVPSRPETPAQKKRRQAIARRAANRKYRLKATYHLTPEQWQALHDRYDGKCWICLGTSRVALSVDHDHACCSGPVSCGKCVRGLLCKRDNYWLLGRVLRESSQGTGHAIEHLTRAIAYLKGEL